MEIPKLNNWINPKVQEVFHKWLKETKLMNEENLIHKFGIGREEVLLILECKKPINGKFMTVYDLLKDDKA